MAVRFRDLKNAIGYGLRVWMYATPVAYSASLIPDRWQWLYRLNPMYWVIEGFRWALLGKGQPPQPIMLIPVIFVSERSERPIVADILKGGFEVQRSDAGRVEPSEARLVSRPRSGSRDEKTLTGGRSLVSIRHSAALHAYSTDARSVDPSRRDAICPARSLKIGAFKMSAHRRSSVAGRHGIILTWKT